MPSLFDENFLSTYGLMPFRQRSLAQPINIEPHNSTTFPLEMILDVFFLYDRIERRNYLFNCSHNVKAIFAGKMGGQNFGRFNAFLGSWE